MAWETLALIGGLFALVAGSFWVAIKEAKKGAKSDARLGVVEDEREREREAEKILDGPGRSGNSLFDRLRRKHIRSDDS